MRSSRPSAWPIASGPALNAVPRVEQGEHNPSFLIVNGGSNAERPHVACAHQAPDPRPRRPAPLLHPILRHKHGYARTGDGTSLCCHARPQLGPSAPREPYSIPSEEDATHGPSKVLERATHLRPMSHVAWSVPHPSPFSLAAVPPPFHGTAHMHVIVLMRSVCPVQGQRDRNSSSAGVEQVEQVE
jgi:hypothetical protein